MLAWLVSTCYTLEVGGAAATSPRAKEAPQMSQTNGIATTGSAGLAAQQQRLSDLEQDLMKFEVAKIATGGILREIRDDALFLVAGGTGARAYADFASYCADRWNIGDREVARRIEAFENVQKLIEAGVDPLAAPKNPWQAREVAVLINQVGLPAAVTTWQKALTDSQNPTINPAGVMTGEFQPGRARRRSARAAPGGSAGVRRTASRRERPGRRRRETLLGQEHPASQPTAGHQAHPDQIAPRMRSPALTSSRRCSRARWHAESPP